MRYVKLTIIGLISSMFLFSPALPVQAQDQSQNAGTSFNQEICEDNPDAAFCTELREGGGTESVFGSGGIVATVLNLLSIVIGFASVVVIMIGGLRYILASGDPNNINAAKNTILYAIVGLAVAAMAQAIVLFVLNRL
ncbi:MAG: pilin [Candidatus Saccharibacteria bacterium]|nr:pilin [Candidatus Saccharibacteria bacterium]